VANPRTIARLEARIHERAAYCLQFEISDPRAGFITITRVELSHDLSAGKIHYSVLGDEADKSRAAHMLASAAGYIQRQVSGVLSMRRMPRLVWHFDDSVEKAASLDQLIRDARERDRSINPNADTAPLAVDEGESVNGPDTEMSGADDAEDGDEFESESDEGDEVDSDDADTDDERSAR
jgi:ribosome-binding factor A